MHSVVEELWQRIEAHGVYSIYYILGTQSRDDIKRFLFATMDEVRLRYAASCTKTILRNSDLADADHFRQGLMRREITQNIAYPKQRDHSAHTLHNYLLGWYIYQGSPLVEKKINEHFDIRDCPNDSGVPFLNLWPFVSLLHDIGYLFEGSITPLSTDLQHKQVQIGAEVAHDYFHHRFWIENGADSIYDRARLRKLAHVAEPDFSNVSLAGVADSLRSLGDLERLRNAMLEERRIRQLSPKYFDFLNQQNGLPGDAFDLWQRHYEYFGLTSMAARIQAVRGVFDSFLREGIGGGIRVLDHGVCSGLLLLLYSTFYFRVYFGLTTSSPSDANDNAIVTRFRQAAKVFPPDPFPEPRYEALWWWAGVVWATGATAIHNVQQIGSMHKSVIKPLQLDEDPLAYLGILVDCIQEWDRYTVSRESVIAGVLPLQGADVKLANEGERIQIDYSDPDRAAKVCKDLDNSLSDEWKQILDILG